MCIHITFPDPTYGIRTSMMLYPTRFTRRGCGNVCIDPRNSNIMNKSWVDLVDAPLTCGLLQLHNRRYLIC